MTPDQAAAAYARYAQDPFLFLTECCFTKDQVDTKNPIKLIPSDWPYLKLYVRLWQRYPRIAVPKSRRMTMSWTNIALCLWEVLFHRVKHTAFVSKKEDDASELVKRAEFIYDRIPAERFPRDLLPKKDTRAKPQTLSFPELESLIQGFPMGADQLRQYTFSRILGDEAAFWEEFIKFYSAALPTLEGGGCLNLISSRHPGGFQKIVYDQLDANEVLDESPPVPPSYPLGDDSVIFWINPKNKFAVFDLHYTANPRKRDPGFREAVRNSMPIKEYLVEYERNWQAFDGRPVYEDFSPAYHKVTSPNEPHIGLPLLCGWDFGLTPAVICAQLREGRLFILKEITSDHMGIERFAPLAMQKLFQLFPQWRDHKKSYLHFIDPAGLDENQTNERTCASYMFDAGIRNIAPGPLRFVARRKAVEHFLLRRTKEGPAFQIYEPDAPVLVKGFLGGYRYPEKYDKTSPKGEPWPIKNKFSHPHDALQYLCGGALTKQTDRQYIHIPVPDYSFLRGTGGIGEARSRQLGLS